MRNTTSIEHELARARREITANDVEHLAIPPDQRDLQYWKDVTDTAAVAKISEAREASTKIVNNDESAPPSSETPK